MSQRFLRVVFDDDDDDGQFVFSLLSSSCTTMRDENADNNTAFVMTSFNGDCVSSQTNWTNGPDFVVGSSESL